MTKQEARLRLTLAEMACEQFRLGLEADTEEKMQRHFQAATVWLDKARESAG